MTSTTPEHLDVLIVGAGLSGIGAAHRLATEAPAQAWAILEARDAIGGTWDRFRFPGMRCDSDVATLAYPFRPWRGRQAIASGQEVLDYLRQVAAEHDIAARVRTGHRVIEARWSSAQARWSVTARTAEGDVRLTATFLYFCSGYFSHDAGHAPRLDGRERFGGSIIHPQDWPADLDVAERDVVVLGSGATAVTLAPALAAAGARVTMLQRSPSWVCAVPRRRRHPRVLAGPLARAQVALCRRFPTLAARWLTRGVRRRLPDGYRVDRHFTPRYAPWDQRLCLDADGELLAAVSAGAVEVVTDHVAHLDERGIVLASGGRIDADVLVTATGLRLVTFGGARLSVDGVSLDPAALTVSHGTMFAGVPNLAWCVGSPRAAWTTRSDASARFVVRFVERLRTRSLAAGTPEPRPAVPDARPMIDLTSTYVARVAAWMPRAEPRRARGLDDAMIWTTRAPERDTLPA